VHSRVVPDSAASEQVERGVNHVAALAGRGRHVARIDREAAPDVRRLLEVFFAEQLLAVVGAQQEGERVDRPRV
jgi:hypothetical protein